MSSPAEVIAQILWETYIAETGHPLPAGLAAEMGSNAIAALATEGYEFRPRYHRYNDYGADG